MTFSFHHSGCIRWANNKKCPQEVPVGTSWNVLSQQIVKQKLKRYSVYINSKVKTKTVCVCCEMWTHKVPQGEVCVTFSVCRWFPACFLFYLLCLCGGNSQGQRHYIGFFRLSVWEILANTMSQERFEELSSSFAQVSTLTQRWTDLVLEVKS